MKFALAGDVAVAYRVEGGGTGPTEAPALVFLLPRSNVGFQWPDADAFLRRLGEFCTLIAYDKRGTGLSDRRVESPTLEERAEDVVAILDAEGIEQASLFGISEGGSLAAYVAATNPDRVRSIVIWGTPARFIRDDAHPWGYVSRKAMDAFMQAELGAWGSMEAIRATVAVWAPSKAGDEDFALDYLRYTIGSLSRDAIPGYFASIVEYDLADVFPAVRTPTLIMHRTDDLVVPVAQGRRLAEVMPDARFVELPGNDHLPFLGDIEPVLSELHHFLTGKPTGAPVMRRLLTLLVTDIVGSTSMVEAMGDDAWRGLLARFDERVRALIVRYNGREIKQTGDGFMVAFDGPARAITCAMTIADAAERLDLGVRTGVHTGECEVLDDDIAGIAVHVASRLSDVAAPGQIITSATVRDLVSGSGIRFGDGFEVELEGLAGRRSVHEVVRRGATPAAVHQLEASRSSRLERAGDYWTVAHAGKAVAVRHLAGLVDLCALLDRPGQEVHVLDLSAPDGAGRRAAPPAELLDDAAKADYRRRLADLDTEADEAFAANDLERAERLDDERSQLIQELGRAYGLGGRSRAFNDEGERARKAVSKRIRLAIDRISEAHRVLGRHLEATVRTGMYCAYEPDPVVHWDIAP